MTRMTILAVALAAMSAGCRLHDGCTPLSSRCDGRVAQLCDTATDWVDVVDCDAVSAQTGEPWSCVELDPKQDGVSGATCVPDDPRPRVAEAP